MALLPIEGATGPQCWHRTKARIIQVTIHHLVLAEGELKLPARVVAFRVGIEPAGKRQAELDESAKRRGWAAAGQPRPVRQRSFLDGATGSSQRAAIGSSEGDLRRPVSPPASVT